MAVIEGDVLIQTEQADGAFICEEFTGIPVARPSWICLTCAGSAKGRALANELREELSAVLLASSPLAAKKAAACPVAPDQMQAKDYPEHRKTLALIATSDGPLSAEPWYDNWQSDDYAGAVMTLLEPGTPFEKLILPTDEKNVLRRVNACGWKTKISETLPAVMSRAEITAAQARVFISYRRVETLPVALQLFDALVHEGFDVFLDRFSIPPGYDFQRRLDQELADKSMVLLLESKHIKVSQWTQHEIDFAKRNRLGLMAVAMPLLEPADRLASIHPDARQTLYETDFDDKPTPVADPDRGGQMSDQWPKMKDDALKRIVAETKTAHATALFRRRHLLRADLVAALQKAKVNAQYTATGPLHAMVGSEDHLLWLATRPADTSDFQSLYGAHHARTASDLSRAIVISPQAALEPDRQKLLEWLGLVSKCLSFDEGDLAGFAKRVAEGDLP